MWGNVWPLSLWPTKSKEESHVHSSMASGGKSALTCAQSATRSKFEILFGVKGEDDARFIQLQNCKHIYKVSGLDQWMDVTTWLQGKWLQISHLEQRTRWRTTHMRCCPKSTRRTRRTPHLVAMQEPGMLKLVTGEELQVACMCV